MGPFAFCTPIGCQHGAYSHPYSERVTRITTPFEQFMHDLLTWLDSAWFVWIAMGLSIVLVVGIVRFSKAKARARARVPQYRRQRES
jgi:uncharacterized membrane protein